MTPPLRRTLLWILTLLGALVGVWALGFPVAFYEDFPGFGLHWVSGDGPFNEHLVRDVGAFYLALTAGGVVAALSRDLAGGRAIGTAWIVFSLPHLAYHLGHLGHLAVFDAIAQVIALSVSLVLAVLVVLPDRRPIREAPSMTTATSRP